MLSVLSYILMFIDSDAPVIRCHPTLAHIGQRDVFVACEVKSRPNLVSLHWQIDRNGTTVSQGSSWEDYWTLVMAS